MRLKESEIKKGIKLHLINTDKFKTSLVVIMLTTKIDRENVTKNALIPAVLKRGTAKLKTQEEIYKRYEEMYGASSGCSIDKIGDNQILKFYIETINNEFLPNDSEDMLEAQIENIFDFIFNPLIENSAFKKEYVEHEKENLKQIIQEKKDNKASYAINRCIEEMYKNKPYGLYKYGYEEDLDKIDEKNLYEQYLKLLDECKIDIFVSGIIDENIENKIKINENIVNLKEREAKFNKIVMESKQAEKENIVEESLDVAQGKLVLGLNLDIDNEDLKYDALIYNTILGGSANSKLFQNVREKESLAYTASSNYHNSKNNIFINCGIEIENYERALKIIKEQIEDMKNGNFTEEDIDNAKKTIISNVNTISDEQSSEVSYFFAQELSNIQRNLEEYKKEISNVNKEKVLNIAQNISIDTIYFLKK